MAGWYDDDEPGSPWRVSVYFDEQPGHEQHAALAAIFLGRAGGTTLRNFAAAVGTVHAVGHAGIELSHVPRRWSIRADSYLTVRAETLVEARPGACGIPGFDQPGQEVVAGTFRVEDAPLSWELHGRCGFAAGFAYSSFQQVSPRINDGTRRMFGLSLTGLDETSLVGEDDRLHSVAQA